MCLLAFATRSGCCRKCLIKLARPRGVEPLTPRSVVWCSIQLSYGRINDLRQSLNSLGIFGLRQLRSGAPYLVARRVDCNACLSAACAGPARVLGLLDRHDAK